MGISQQIGASSLSKPGVCTSSTRPATPYEGQMIYETDTDLSYIYGNSAWQQIAGSTAVGNSGLVYVTQASWVSGGSLSVNNCFTSTYTDYKLVIRDAKHATTSVNMLFRLRVGGVDTGGTGYYWAKQYIAMGGGSGGTAGASAAAHIECGVVASTANAGSGVIEVIDPQLAAVTSVHFQGIWAITGGEASVGSGLLNNTTQYDGFSLHANTGNLTGLTVYVYGYRNS